MARYSLQETFYGPNGEKYQIYRRQTYRGGIKQTYQTKDFEVRKDGQRIARTSPSKTAAKNWILTNENVNVEDLRTEGEYKDFKQTEKFTAEYDEALKKSEFKQKQSIEQAGKMQQTLQAQAGGAQMQQIQNALLQQGYTPEEAAQISSGGTESIQRGAASVQQQVAAQQAGVEANMAGMDVGKITSASQLQNQLRQMTTQDKQFAEQMAFQKDQAKTSWGDVLGGAAGMFAGSYLGGLGQVASGALRKGGDVKEYKHGGEVEPEKYRKGGFQSGFVEGMKASMDFTSEDKEDKKDKKRDGGMLINYFK